MALGLLLSPVRLNYNGKKQQTQADNSNNKSCNCNCNTRQLNEDLLTTSASNPPKWECQSKHHQMKTFYPDSMRVITITLEEITKEYHMVSYSKLYPFPLFQTALVAARFFRLGCRPHLYHRRDRIYSWAEAAPPTAAATPHAALQQGKHGKPAPQQRLHAGVRLLLGPDPVDGHRHRETGAAVASPPPAAGDGHAAAAPPIPKRVSEEPVGRVSHSGIRHLTCHSHSHLAGNSGSNSISSGNISTSHCPSPLQPRRPRQQRRQEEDQMMAKWEALEALHLCSNTIPASQSAICKCLRRNLRDTRCDVF